MQTQPPGLRGLKALVGFLGLLIVLGTALVIGVVIKRIYASPVPASMSPAVRPSAFTPAAALLPGEHIAGLAGAGGEIAVWVQGPAGARVILIDPVTGTAHTALHEVK